MSIGTMRGISNPALYLENAKNSLMRRQRDTFTFSRQPAYDALWEAWQPCKQANWDGAGAAPIEQETYQIAYRLIEALPYGFPSPSVSAEPDGHLSFEWYRHPRKILTVSISPDGTLFWAALVGTEDPRGSCQFFDEFPETIRTWIGRVCRG